MKVIGLTGGIASGKSTVARLLREAGVAVLDADQVAREVVAPGTVGHRRVAERWPQVIRGDGELDRKALGAIVFADPAARRELDSLVHPLIQEEVQRRTAALAAAGEPRVVYEAALIVENDLDAWMDALIVVSAPEEEQLRRAIARDGLSPADALARLRAQAPLAKKLARATFVIENSGDLAALEQRVREVWAEVERRY